MEILEQMSAALQRGKAKDVQALIKDALAQEITPQQILDEGLLSGMNVIGEKFKNNLVFVPEVLVAARAMNKGLEVLRPVLLAAGGETKGKVVIGTVKGDLHDIGKNLVKTMIESKGFEIVDLGVDVPASKFVEAAKENSAIAVCCSALLTTTMNEMANVVEAFNESGIRNSHKIMIGGSPIDQKFCDRIGADIYTENAVEAAEVLMTLS